MSKAKKNNNYAIYIFLIIGIVLIGIGVFNIITISGYSKTVGTFTGSSQYEERDTSDGGYYTYYKWHYKFMVDDVEYILVSNGKPSDHPKKNEDIILYNPQNPNWAVLKSENLGMVMIIAGSVFASVFFFFGKTNIKDELLSEEDKKIKKDRKDAIFMLFFSCALFLIMCLSVDFDMLRLFQESLFAVIIIALFIIVSVALFVKANSTDNIISKK